MINLPNRHRADKMARHGNDPPRQLIAAPKAFSVLSKFRVKGTAVCAERDVKPIKAKERFCERVLRLIGRFFGTEDTFGGSHISAPNTRNFRRSANLVQQVARQRAVFFDIYP